MNLNQIQYVIMLAKEKNFTQAAKKLYITQPTLSQQIKKLEEEFGVPLFNRSKNEITLTKAGQDFLFYADRITSNIHKLSTSLNNYCSLETGTIHIGLLLTFGYTEIPNLIASFQKIYPKIQIKIYVNVTTNLIDMLNQNKLDIVFVTGNPSSLPNNLDIDLISQSEMMCIMHKDHVLATHDKIVPEDLHQERILMVDKNSLVYPELNKALHKGGLEPIIIGENSSADVALQMAQHNLSISFMSKEIAQNSSLENIIIKPMYPILYRNIYLAIEAKNQNAPAVSVFRDYVISEIMMKS